MFAMQDLDMSSRQEISAISRHDTITTLKAQLCEMFALSNDDSTRMWLVDSDSGRLQLALNVRRSGNRRLEQFGISDLSIVTVEKQLPSGRWPSMVGHCR